MPKHKIIVAGCGGMANAWVEYGKKRTDAEIVALVDISEAQARKLAHQHDLIVPFFVDLKKAIQATGANVVFDTTIPEVHKQIALASFEAGCDLMGEKPMAASYEDAQAVLAAAQAHERFYAIMQNRRFNSHIRGFREIIKQGHIGTTGLVSADFFLGPHFGGFRDAMASPLILDMAIHTFDQARFISGADPISVYCHEFNPQGSWYAGNAAAICIFEMSDGSVFNYRGSWCAEGAPTSWESEWRITGTRGTAIWDGTNSPYYEVIKPTEDNVFLNEFDRIVPTPYAMENEGHHACLDEMFDALNNNRKAETDCADNVKSMQMVFGAIESAASGKKIQLG
jgi:predicted dehydrogenase